MTFLRFLAWTFYWLRLELAAMQEPARSFIVARSRGRWRVYYGETGRALDELEAVPVQGEGREAWQALRHALEGIDPSAPLEFTTEALAAAADKLEAEHEKAAERDLAELERERDRRRGALESAQERRAELERELAELAEAERIAAEQPPRPKSGHELALEAEAELEAERAREAAEHDAGAGDVAGELELEEPAHVRELEQRPRRGF